MSWPRCSECGSPDVENVDGPAYSVEGSQIAAYRSHRCRACGWTAWSRQVICAEGPHLVGTIRAKFGGFNAQRALRCFSPRRSRERTTEELLFDE